MSTISSSVSSLESQVTSIQDDIEQIQPGSVSTMYYGFQHQTFGELELVLTDSITVTSTQTGTMTGGSATNPGYDTDDSLIYVPDAHAIQHSVFTQNPIPSTKEVSVNLPYIMYMGNNAPIFEQMTAAITAHYSEMYVISTTASYRWDYIDGSAALLFANDNESVIFGLYHPLLNITSRTGVTIPNSSYYQYPFDSFSEFDRNLSSNVNLIPSGTYHLIGVPTNLLPRAPSYVDMPEHIDIGTL